MSFPSRESYKVKNFSNANCTFFCWHSSDLECEGDVLGHRPPWQQEILLSYITNISVDFLNELTTVFHTPLGWADEPSGEVEQGRLATTARSDNRDELTWSYTKIESLIAVNSSPDGSWKVCVTFRNDSCRSVAVAVPVAFEITVVTSSLPVVGYWFVDASSGKHVFELERCRSQRTFRAE